MVREEVEGEEIQKTERRQDRMEGGGACWMRDCNVMVEEYNNDDDNNDDDNNDGAV